MSLIIILILQKEKYTKYDEIIVIVEFAQESHSLNFSFEYKL